MIRLAQPGRVCFAIGIAALGMFHFILGDFITGRPPTWPAELPGNIVWAYLSGAFLIITGLAVVVNKKAGILCLITGLLIFLYSFLLRHLPVMFGNSIENNLWSLNAYKTLALAGGACIVAVSFFEEKQYNKTSIFSNNNLLLISTIFIAIFFVDGGLSHFKYAEFVIGFIPDYIPAHGFFTYFCGVALIAGGIGILIKRTRTWAAALSGLMVFLWFVLLHIPRFIAKPDDPSDRMGLCESLAISGILFVLAAVFAKKEASQVKLQS